MVAQNGDSGDVTMEAAKKVSKYQTGSRHVRLKSQNESISLLVSPALAFLIFLIFLSLSFFLVHSAGL